MMFLVLIVAALSALPAAAQDSTISDDEVNAVAKQLFCPVCENIPLDVCPTVACKEWREEIRTQLASGMSEDAVISDFVQRYGERVVGTPQDPTLRALSLVTPWLLGLIAVLVAGFTFMRWRTGKPRQTTPLGPVSESGARDDDYYRTRIEQDLLQRR
ncbi:MAG: cytochrome c-type biogenesis protein CcmH [Anaerolineae bacterium]|nr:cytochrome c-type biogenesis protein CcmH [Anaerolineae bacterium]